MGNNEVFVFCCYLWLMCDGHHSGLSCAVLLIAFQADHYNLLFHHNNDILGIQQIGLGMPT